MIRTAATILLGRDHNDELEVLLLKRNKALAFAGGLWVFPGGKIEPTEIEQNPDELSAAKVAAVRETMEETNLEIDKEQIIFFRHWTTPVIEPRRYATYFFFAGVPATNADVKIDDSEIKEHLWITPQKAIDKLKAGKLAMLPPTLMSLQLIKKCKTVADAKKLLQQEEPIFVLPVLQSEGGKMICMYQGDAGYDSGNPKTEGPRHRLTIDMTKGNFAFEYENCEEFLPINGGMHL